MNLKHGFDSNNPTLNGDMRILQSAVQAADLTTDDLVYAERFLFGDTCSDPVRAHQIVKVVYQAGERRFPTLWKRTKKYVHGYEYEAMEKLSSLK
jgi:hypothetical protein